MHLVNVSWSEIHIDSVSLWNVAATVEELFVPKTWCISDMSKTGIYLFIICFRIFMVVLKILSYLVILLRFWNNKTKRLTIL